MVRNKFEICDEEARYEYNRKIKVTYETTSKEWVMQQVEDTIPMIEPKKDKVGTSQALEEFIEARMKAIQNMDTEDAKEINKDIIKQRKRERKSKFWNRLIRSWT